MNIAFDATSLFNFSGIDTYSRELITALVNISPELSIKLITSENQISILEDRFSHYSNVEAVQLFPNKVLLGKIGRSLLKRKKARIFAENANKFDLIHQTNPFNALKNVTNLVTTVHDLIPIYNAHYVKSYLTRKYKDKLNIILKNSKAIIVPTEFVKKELIEYNSMAASITYVVHEAASIDFKPTQPDAEFFTKYGLLEGEKFFLYAGRIDARKNIGGLIKSYIDLPDIVKNEFKLILIASGDSHYLEQFPIIKEKGLKDRIIHINGVQQSDLIKFFSSSYCFVMPSFSEGFGLPVLEAFQCGSPVISSNVTSIPEISGDAAILIDPYDGNQLTKAMNNIAEDNSLRLSLIEKGFKQAGQFSWLKAAKETLKIYKKVL
jgi:glycosyltransferase involved in cell wall biosynthesis